MTLCMLGLMVDLILPKGLAFLSSLSLLLSTISTVALPTWWLTLLTI